MGVGASILGFMALNIKPKSVIRLDVARYAFG